MSTNLNEAIFEIDLGEDVEPGPELSANRDRDPDRDLDAWAQQQLSKPQSLDRQACTGIAFDIETGPLETRELRDMFQEKTFEEFSADCDQRWKPETKAAKYEEYKDEAWSEFVDRAALSAATGRVLIVGTLDRGSPLLFDQPDESAILSSWWALVEQCLADKVPMVGHNSNGFDLPFMVRRSWMLGVPVPREIRQGRYWHPLFKDTMEIWNCGARDYVKLDLLAKFFGVGQKTEGVKGADFGKLWFGTKEEHAKAVEYHKNDLVITAAVARKMGLM